MFDVYTEALKRCVVFALLHAQPKFRSHSHRTQIAIYGIAEYFHQKTFRHYNEVVPQISLLE